ncbi:hypothetical protein CW304_06840 [Bacillus sp. UFRGS-B20]|nr:hypothetical protein CW304_06840 [Bacillus sp. UFRGS-B20]
MLYIARVCELKLQKDLVKVHGSKIELAGNLILGGNPNYVVMKQSRFFTDGIRGVNVGGVGARAAFACSFLSLRVLYKLSSCRKQTPCQAIG